VISLLAFCGCMSNLVYRRKAPNGSTVSSRKSCLLSTLICNQLSPVLLTLLTLLQVQIPCGYDRRRHAKQSS
jgi:hypothetical protein